MKQSTATLIGMPNSKYRLLKQELEKAIEEIPFSIALKEVNEVDKILAYSVASIPAVVVNDNVIFENGRVPDKEELLENIFNHFSIELDMKNIIVPIDFSQNSLHAYSFAQQLAEQMKSNLKLVHFTTIHIDPYMVGASNIDAIQEKNQEDLEHFLEQHRFLNKDFKITAEAKIGFAGECIINLSKEEEVDLILMGTTGASSLERKLFGSVSIKVAKEAKCPVVLIPPNAKFRGIKEILFLSEQLEANAITKLMMKQLCEKFDAFSHLVHIKKVKNESFQLSQLNIETIDNHRAYKAVEIESTSIVDAVNEYAEHHPIDLNVIITQHRTFLEHLFHKSVTKEMAMRTEVPLMILHLDV